MYRLIEYTRINIVNFFASIVQRLFTWIMNADPANEILPGLWLGNKQASQDTQWLRAKQITAVFNCTKDIPFAPGTLHMYRIPVDDNLEDQELRNLELWAWESTYKVMKELNEGNRVLVHCFAGVQRSAAVVAMTLIAKYRCTAEEAIAFIQRKRPIAFYHQANFFRSIKGFEKSLSKMIVDGNLYKQYPKLQLPL